ncbi:Putative sporulation-specific glycosylase YdhD [Streptomyces hundungensis]|uniref:Sporulation-specific glycosylase YdhD n=1 Tax=Streptomyces hundungensis TaxID=1077946 RepID=A0A387H6W8_9ACTN|nr:glycosyl hydrolase family 18 protein [Streptomyces hundungensis]AYG79164.1 Putative sporulation-specific glycosylase YdhD [Streptomyces hundungensis]
MAPRSRTRLCLAALGAATALLTALLHAPARAEEGPARTVSGWLPYWDQEGAYADVLRHSAQLHTVSPFWYQAKAADRVEGHPGAGENRIIDGLHQAGIKVVPTVMETMKAGELAAILTDPGRRATHVETLLAVVSSRTYDGIDIDYESIASTGDAEYPAVRAAYASFAGELCGRLRALGKRCLLTVSPQTATTGRIWDYAALGRVADRVRIMGYDLHWQGGEAGPLASPQWYDDILRRATALIPADKLEMGLPAYGWDWVAGGATRHVTWREAEALRVAKGAPYRLDPASQTPHFSYEEDGAVREVWYQDAAGVSADLPVLRRYGIRNTTIWALGFEDPELWPVLGKV